MGGCAHNTHTVPLDMQSFPHFDPIPNNSCHCTPAEEMPKFSEVAHNSVPVPSFPAWSREAGRAGEPLMAGSCKNNSSAMVSCLLPVPVACDLWPNAGRPAHLAPVKYCSHVSLKGLADVWMLEGAMLDN